MSTFDLFSSVRDGNTEIVRRLLQSKLCRARLNDRNEWGDTALHLAAEAGNGELGVGMAGRDRGMPEIICKG